MHWPVYQITGYIIPGLEYLKFPKASFGQEMWNMYTSRLFCWKFRLFCWKFRSSVILWYLKLKPWFNDDKEFPTDGILPEESLILRNNEFSCTTPYQTLLLTLSSLYSLWSLQWLKYKHRMPTLSTFILLNDACRSLKLWMYSCSSFAWNFTFFKLIHPGNNMSMNWQ